LMRGLMAVAMDVSGVSSLLADQPPQPPIVTLTCLVVM